MVNDNLKLSNKEKTIETTTIQILLCSLLKKTHPLGCTMFGEVVNTCVSLLMLTFTPNTLLLLTLTPPKFAQQ